MITNNKKFILPLIILYTIEGLAANLAHPVTPQLIKNLDMPAYMFGLAFSLMQLGTFLFSPFWGVLSTIIQPKLVLLIGSLGYAFGQYLFSIASSGTSLLVARFVSGVGVSATTVAALYLLVQLTDTQTRKTWMPLMVTAFLVSGTFGQMLGGLLGTDNLYIPFNVQIALLIVCGIGFFTLSPLLPKRKRLNIKDTLIQSNPVRAFFSIKDHLTPSFIVQFSVVFLLSFAATSLSQTFGYYLVDVFQQGSNVNGLARGIIGFMSLALNTFVASKISSRTSTHKIILYVVGVTAMTSFGIVINASLMLPFIIFAIIAMTFDTLTVATLQEQSTSMAHDAIQGIVLGTHNSVKSLGAVIGATIAGLVYDFDAIAPFTMTLALYLIVMVIFKTYSRSNHRS